MSKLIVGALIILFLTLYILTISKVYKQTKKGKKIHPLWLLLIAFVPVLGPLLYLSRANHH